MTLYGYADPAEQVAMVLDRVRVDAYARAIAAVVRPGDVVVDLGSGSGLLALLAARAGAATVYAIERTGAIELVRAHAAAAGVADRVVPLRADIAELDGLPQAPRVILGELLGHFAPAESSHRLYRLALGWARPDAVTVPGSYRLRFAAARPRGLAADLAALADVHGVALPLLAERLRRRVAFTRLAPDELCGPEVDGEEIAQRAPTPEQFVGSAPVTVDGPVTAIAVSFVATLAPGVELTSAVGAPRTSWVQTVFPIDPPLEARAGDQLTVELWPRVAFAAATWSWRVRRGDLVRTGDAADALVGERDDLLAQLGARRAGPIPASPPVRALAAALGAEVPAQLDLDQLTARLCAALPTRYPDAVDARQEIVALLRDLTRAE